MMMTGKAFDATRTALAKALEPLDPDYDPIMKRAISDDKRKDLAGKGQALPDGSYFMETCGDVSNALQSIGRAGDNRGAVIALAKKRNSALSCGIKSPLLGTD